MSDFKPVNQTSMPTSADPGEEFPFLHTITVIDRVVSVDKPELVQNNIKTETVTLNLDSEWDGLSCIINIGNGDTPTSLIWSGQPVTIPAELMTNTGTLNVSVVGYGDDGALRAVTKKADAMFTVVASGYVEGDEPVPDPTTILGQLIEAADNANQAADRFNQASEDIEGIGPAVEKVQASEANAKQSETNAASSAQSASQSASTASASAEAAKTSETNAASSATAAARSADDAAASAEAAKTSETNAAEAAASISLEGTAVQPVDNGWNAVDFDTMLTPGFTKFAGDIADNKAAAEAIFGKDVQSWQRGWVLTIPTINLSVSQIVCFDISSVRLFARCGSRSDLHSPLTFGPWQKVELFPAVSGPVYVPLSTYKALETRVQALESNPSGGLSSVTHDSTLLGDGTSSNPLKLAKGTILTLNVVDRNTDNGKTFDLNDLPEGFTRVIGLKKNLLNLPNLDYIPGNYVTGLVLATTIGAGNKIQLWFDAKTSKPKIHLRAYIQPNWAKWNTTSMQSDLNNYVPISTYQALEARVQALEAKLANQ